MAKKKKTQFKGAKYKDGILSYNYLGGKGGKGRGAVSIKKQGDDWFFVDDKGEIRDALGNGGKLTPTHINNLKRDGIFEAVKVNPDTGVEIKAGDSGDIDAQEVRMPRGGESDTSSFEQTANYQVAPQTDSASFGRGYGKYTYPGGEGTAVASAPVPVKQGGMGAQSEWADKGLKSEPTYYQGEAMGLEGQNFAPAQTWEGAGQISLPSQPINNVTSPQSLAAGQMSSPNNNVITPSTPSIQRELGPTTSEWAAKGYINEQAMDKAAKGGFNPESAVDYRKFTGGQTNFRGLDAAGTTNLNTKGLDIGTGGDGSMWDSSFYRTKDGTLMKDTPWYKGGEDTVATQADIDAGIKDQNASPWGSAAGWQAAGSVMKGVGGLASAYTGLQNYRLARDAFGAQKDQWQADYNQRLKAYEDNKKLANQEIEARNRTLQARGQAADQYSKL